MTSADTTLPLDPWVVSSLLQKAIRRGEVDHAVCAARILHRQRGSSIWRRFLIIACEDVGIADLDLVGHVTVLSVDRTMRKPFGTDDEIVVNLARRMAEAAKDRSSDYLICAAIQHPDYEHDREAVAALPIDNQIAVAIDSSKPVIRRAIAAWYASGVNGGGPRVVGPGDLPRLLHEFDLPGFPHSLAAIIEAASHKTKEPMVVMLPLLWTLLQESNTPSQIAETTIPAGTLCGNVPAWTFDKHTAIGKRAVAQFIRENTAVDVVLSRYVADFRARDVAAMACFYADAVSVSRRLMWSRSHQLEALGLEVDMLKVGCPREGIQPILAAVRAHLDHLNAIRCRLFTTRAIGGHSA